MPVVMSLKCEDMETDNQQADIFSTDKEFLEQLLDYCQYLYEEEKERRDILNKTMQIYLGALGFAIGVVILKLTSIDKILALIQKASIHGQNIQSIVITLFVVSAMLFVFSFISTLLVVKMWKRERPSDPESLVTKSASMESINTLLSTIIADYAVAANRNHNVNEQKALLLCKALYLFLASLLIFSIAYILIISLTNGGCT